MCSSSSIQYPWSFPFVLPLSLAMHVVLNSLAAGWGLTLTLLMSCYCCDLWWVSVVWGIQSVSSSAMSSRAYEHDHDRPHQQLPLQWIRPNSGSVLAQSPDYGHLWRICGSLELVTLSLPAAVSHFQVHLCLSCFGRADSGALSILIHGSCQCQKTVSNFNPYWPQIH